uniref:Uncharacterized protein n=1 Tax=Rhodosorus marinus TaxID=101924 RepID=A0A7S2ZHZ4_9RHOD|mmetsp:Transcript_19706/g.78316  ORF Transcript_19706/g.78316 Transcript_19706/m.78316 type:complete len:437 (+) Transcript_19706:718-2028(+)
MEVNTTKVENGFVRHLGQLHGRILEVGSPSRFFDRALLEPIVLYKSCSSTAVSCFVSNDGRTTVVLNWDFPTGSVGVNRIFVPSLVQSISTFPTRKYEFGECVGDLSASGKYLAFGGGDQEASFKSSWLFFREKQEFFLCSVSDSGFNLISRRYFQGNINAVKFSPSEEYVAILHDDVNVVLMNVSGTVVWERSLINLNDATRKRITFSFSSSDELLMLIHHSGPMPRSGPEPKQLELFVCGPPFVRRCENVAIQDPPKFTNKGARQAQLLDGDKLVVASLDDNFVKVFQIRKCDDRRCFQLIYTQSMDIPFAFTFQEPSYFDFAREPTGNWLGQQAYYKTEKDGSRSDGSGHQRIFRMNRLRPTASKRPPHVTEWRSAEREACGYEWNCPAEISCAISGEWCAFLSKTRDGPVFGVTNLRPFLSGAGPWSMLEPR